MKTLKAMLTSKKFVTMAIAIVVWLAAVFGFDVSADALDKLFALTIAPYLVGQGIADHGKEAAKIVAAAVPPVVP